SLDGEALKELVSYWTQRLANAAPLPLPTDRPPPLQRARLGGRVALTLDAATARALARVARSERATPFMALLAVFQLLLERWTGEPDVSVGAPIALREPRAA